jgi:cyclic beta-1,2-glucan synthetase
LIRPRDRLALLLTPPFDKSNPSPGYIQGYPPGIRENGGQYTHAAMWVVQALATQGCGKQAMQLFDLLNPILSATSAAVERYQVEPYVVAADVYSNPQHVGRGGWTWYTGSAAWMYRVAVESILGLQLRGDHLLVRPRIPDEWDGYEMVIRRGKSLWRIQVDNSHHVESGRQDVLLEGNALPPSGIQLLDDGKEHVVQLTIAPNARTQELHDVGTTSVVERRPRRAVPK